MGTENKYVVYVHASPSNKKYVGITCRPTAQRWKIGGSGYKGCPHFWSAIQKYGWDSFSHEVVVKNLTLAEAASLEIMLIKYYETTNPEFGYNRSTGGEGGRAGYVVSDETREKISAAMKGNQRSLGHKHTVEARAKISAANKGKRHGTALGCKRTTETRAAISAAKRLAAKDVECLTADGVIVGHYNSLAEAAEKTGICRSNISLICLGHNKTAGGFSWRFVDKLTTK